jgi:hypothetical protein
VLIIACCCVWLTVEMNRPMSEPARLGTGRGRHRAFARQNVSNPELSSPVDVQLATHNKGVNPATASRPRKIRLWIPVTRSLNVNA